MFTVEFSSQAKKFLKKSSKELAKRLVNKIKELAKDPFPHEVTRVVSKKEKTFRIRVGDYRISYVVFQPKEELLITEIKKRPRAY